MVPDGVPRSIAARSHQRCEAVDPISSMIFPYGAGPYTHGTNGAHRHFIVSQADSVGLSARRRQLPRISEEPATTELRNRKLSREHGEDPQGQRPVARLTHCWINGSFDAAWPASLRRSLSHIVRKRSAQYRLQGDDARMPICRARHQNTRHLSTARGTQRDATRPNT